MCATWARRPRDYRRVPNGISMGEGPFRTGPPVVRTWDRITGRCERPGGRQEPPRAVIGQSPPLVLVGAAPNCCASRRCQTLSRAFSK